MKILTLPDKRLGTPAKEVGEINAKVRSIIDSMWQIHKEKNALGLAATQIGIDLKIAVIGFDPSESEDLEKYKDMKPISRTVLINPKILSESKEESLEKEACLSYPDENIDVPRHSKILIEYLDENGKKQKMKARGFLARVIQHELDHLNGITISNYK